MDPDITTIEVFISLDTTNIKSIETIPPNLNDLEKMLFSSKAHQIKVDISTFQKVQEFAYELNGKPVLYLQYRIIL